MDTIVHMLQQAAGSPWFYLLIFSCIVVDAFLPMIPGETLVVAAGVFAGPTDLALLVTVAAAAAFLGDHVSYLIGRTGGAKILHRLPFGGGIRALGWASKALSVRGATLLIAARYLPGGRTAVTLSAGSTAFPLRRFVPLVGVAALSWALYSTAIGWIGGATFEHDPLRGLLVGIGVGVGITLLIEVIRLLLRRRSPQPASIAV